ncbi:trypsin-like serine protease [Halorussus aquaticus]|uniref:Trypsin-like serine protease n=1 Tax=Halorussus aquaticus TaxID=2953748 RepID=A0ABD5Q4G7_9EURY|nr:trypsin-like serine protease [Halorussus aquaticus]
MPEERYRRIMAYHKLDPSTVYKRTEGVNGISLQQRSDDPTDLALTVYVNHNKRSVRRALPNRTQKIPVTVKERKVDRKFGSVCDRRNLDFYDPLPANPEVGGYDGDDTSYGQGTLGVVCWNDNPNNAYECYITAAHVIKDNGSYADYLRHGGTDDGTNRVEDVGAYVTHSDPGDYGMDVAKYRRRNGTVTADIRGNADDNIGDLAGTWTHSGLTDRTSGSKSLSVEFAGQSTCYATTECTGTSKTSLVEYQADYSPNKTTDGDSGGPFVDNDDYLVGTFSFFCESCEESHGPTGQELLNRMNAQLTNPKLQ